MFRSEKTVLVIGAHPDDEVLGTGGSMAKFAENGAEVHVLIVTEGTTTQYDDPELIEAKRQHTRACADELGVKETHFGDLPDMKLDELPHVEVNAVIEDVIQEVGPDIVFTHSRREVNRDHVEVHDSTLVATRPGSGVETVLAYETPSSTEYHPSQSGFEPDLFVDISETLNTKVEAFEQYESEVREFPHPRSGEALRALARTRGMASGVPAAECFDILRAYR